MASQNDIGFATFQATPAVSAYRVVELAADGTIKVIVTAESKGIGVTQMDAAAGGYCTVKLWNAPGTFKCAVTGTAVTAATSYTPTVGGLLTAVVTTARVVALESAVASAGIIVEVLPL
jgi:hypothetical protein